MKALNFTTAFLIVFVTNLMAQTEDEPIDPLLGGYTLGASDEIVLLWADFTSTSGGYYHSKLYDYINFNNPDLNNEITIESKDSIAGQRPTQDFLDVFSEDINGDGFDELVSTWAGDGTEPSIKLRISQVDSGSYEFKEVAVLNVPDDNEKIESRTLVRLVPGNFDKDPEKELIVAFLQGDSVKITIYDSDGSLNPERKSAITDESIYTESSAVINYDINAGDLDGDGTDEIVLVGGEWSQVFNSATNEQENLETMFVKIYDVISGETYEIQPKTKTDKIPIIDKSLDEPLGYMLNELRVGMVDFDNNGIKEVVIGYQIYKNKTYFLLQPFKVYENLDSIRIDETQKQLHTNVLDERGGPMTMVAEDVTGDGKEELIFSAWNKLGFYSADPDLNLSSLAEVGLNFSSVFSEDHGNRTMAVTDLDANKAQDEWRKEIVVIDKQEIGEFSSTALTITIFEAKVDFNGELKLVRRANLQDTSITGPQDIPVAVVTGNFEGDGMRLGTPNRYTETGIIQPLVVLNAPPVHFDIFNGETFDINRCFNGDDCNFVATYEEGLSLTEQITTRLNADWGIETKLSSNNELAGVKLNAHLTTNYGDNFSKVENASKTVTVGVEVKAINDDLIYATVGDYTIWEYPVYNDGVFQGYITTTVPQLTENRWFPSKSWNGNPYIPNHEVGNILSYPDFSGLSGFESATETIKGVENNNYTLGPNTTYEWRLEFNDFLENGASQTRKIGLEIGSEVEIGTAGTTEVSAAPFGIGGSVSVDYKVSVGLNIVGNYNTEDFSSHTTTVKKDLLLKVNLGNITGSETGYQVTPYAYWSESGALVIDYAVDIDQAAQGFTPTWWQQNYSAKPDPALILPWRYDPEKGHNLISELKRQQTKDIVIYPKDPQPGDTILIYARIHNYSLMPTPDPVNISFYMGDPKAGGTLVESNDGKTMIATERFLEPRSFQWVHMEWIMPESGGRLYAVLDPENTMDEIHESNNSGWTVLGRIDDDIPDGRITGIPDSGAKKNADLKQNFPNPFSSVTNIKFSLNQSDKISLKVYDLFGHQVSTLLNKEMLPGEYSVEFDGSKLETGIYICRLEGTNYVGTRRLIVR